MVVDTSIVLAILFNEAAGPAALDLLQTHSNDLQMSTVNYAECLILIHDRQPRLYGQLKDLIDASTMQLVPPTPPQAEAAALARIRYPLNLGDCFAYALAKQEGTSLLTLDRDFRKADVKVIFP
ncbi:MAG: PIN domain-containing protein [Acidobacteria bacterium]|nr:PIN domain-containing protein [Acidobacteriota bacterium]